MSDQFFVTKKGGINTDDHQLMEGSAKEGPWYNASLFSDMEIERWESKGWIKFKE